MKSTFSAQVFAAIILLMGSAVTVAQQSASLNAEGVMADLQLVEADTPISEHPNWNPKKILMVELPQLGGGEEEIRAQVREAAGDVEVVFHSSANNLTAEVLAGVDAMLGVCRPNVLEAADDSLLWFHNYFVGVDSCVNVDPGLIANRVFTNSQRLSSPSIAEHTITMMLALTRNFPATMDAQNQRNWDRSLGRHMTFGELTGKTMLVAGLGGIGTEVAKRAHGLGMRVIATRNSSREGPDYVDYVGLAHELNTLAAEADVVVNALPLTNETTYIFDEEFFDAMKSDSIFVSVGRGKSTVTADLISALESGKLYGAGVDVTDPEPLPADSELWNMDNVIITPHIASNGGLSVDRYKVVVLENLRRYVAGEKMLSPVDLSRGY